MIESGWRNSERGIFELLRAARIQPAVNGYVNASNSRSRASGAFEPAIRVATILDLKTFTNGENPKVDDFLRPGVVAATPICPGALVCP